MSLITYSLFPGRYVPQHAVCGARTNTPDEEVVITRSDGGKTRKRTYRARILSVMSDAPMSRAEIQAAACVSKNAVRTHLEALMHEGRAKMADGRIPLYWLVS